MIGALILKLGAGRGWDALNRGDLDDFERFLAEDVVFEQALGLSNTVVTEFELTATRADGTTRVSRGVDVSEMCRGKLVSERT
jgi:hypothetical protein